MLQSFRKNSEAVFSPDCKPGSSNILRILQFGVEDDVPFLVMEYASTLRQLTLAVNDEV
jgi:hypothetical protein